MLLKKLILKNIRSYESLEIEFPNGSLLLAGDIGSGKTTILLALEYALFGLQPGQKGSALLRNGADLGEVNLELEVNGQNVIIERKIKRGSKSINNDYAAITIDDKKLESSITEVKTKILSLLGYPPDFIKKNNILYRYTVYTPQEQTKNIISEDPEVRLNVLRYVFGVDKYKKIRENTVLLVNKLKEEAKILLIEVRSLDLDKEKIAVFEKSVLNLVTQVDERSIDVEKQKGKRKTIESELKELESKIKEKESFDAEIEKTKIIIASKKENLQSINSEIEDILKSLRETTEVFDQEKHRDTLEKITRVKKEIEELSATYFSTSNRIHYLQSSFEEISDKITRVSGIAFCPTCLQDVSEIHKHNIKHAAEKDLKNIKTDLENFNLENKKIYRELSEKKEELIKLEEKRNDFLLLKSKMEYLKKSQVRLDLLQKNRDLLEKDISLLISHIDSLKETILQFAKFSNFYKSKKEELNSAFKEEKNLEISLAELKKELALTEKQISDLQESIKSKEELNVRLSNLNEITEWLSNQFLSLINFTEKNVMIKLRMEFSRLFSKWFSILVPDESLTIQLDENFTPLILQKEIEMDYSFLSGGERTAIALAYRLALNQTINSLLSTIKTKEIIILDEPTEGLSETQIEKIREILQELNMQQLIIVSHENKIESFVDHVYKIRKVSDVSQLLLPESQYLEEKALEPIEEPHQKP